MASDFDHKRELGLELHQFTRVFDSQTRHIHRVRQVLKVLGGLMCNIEGACSVQV